MHSPQRRLELYVLLESLSTSLKDARDADAAVRHTLRAAREYFRADAACIAVLSPGMRAADVSFRVPAGRSWDRAVLTEYIRSGHPAIPPDVLLAPLRRRRRAWGALALARSGASFEKGDVQPFCRIAGALSETIDRIDGERLLEVRSRIDRKIMEELRPRDLFYQILDGLRSLTRYDHSSALLIRHPDEGDLKLEAEQIAWHKGKSHRIGARLSLSADALAVLEQGEVYGFDRNGPSWAQWQGRPALALVDLLDYNSPAERPAAGAPHSTEAAGAPKAHEASMLCATLAARGGAFGVLKIASCHAGSFGPYEAELLDGFRSQAAVAIQNSLRTESLQARTLEAERKHAMADLARGVSHDINNALGAALPLVQQMREDLREGRFEAEDFSEDLSQVQESLQLCRRIFGGMLSFVRGAAGASSEVDVRRAVDAALLILKDGLDRRGIRVVLEIPGDLPPVHGGQSDMERIFFNLINNAREAISDGGRLSVRARPDGEGVEILVEDTGRGIPPEDLPRVQEPFFTTKAHGSGLGLSVCRSILWQMNGDLSIESEVGRGTRVRIRVPRARHAVRSDA